MTDQERNQVLKMIQEGKITPEEGLTLMQALDLDPAEDEPKAEEPAGVNPASGPETQAGASAFETEQHIAQTEVTAARLWQVPLGIGVVVTVLSALGMYAILRGAGMDFWFYFLLLPLFLGVAVIVAAVSSRSMRWVFVDVHRRYGDWPQQIFFGFPLPLKFTAWLLRTLGCGKHHSPSTSLEEVIRGIETGTGPTGDEPLIVNVDEGSPGERVRIYIGIPSARRPAWPVWKNV